MAEPQLCSTDGDADLDPQAAWDRLAIVSIVLRGSLEQQIIDDGLVLVGDGPDPPWQCEHEVEVRDAQQF